MALHGDVQLEWTAALQLGCLLGEGSQVQLLLHLGCLLPGGLQAEQVGHALPATHLRVSAGRQAPHVKTPTSGRTGSPLVTDTSLARLLTRTWGCAPNTMERL